MQNKKVVIIVAIMLLLVAGGIGVIMFQLTNMQNNNDIVIQDSGTETGNLKETHWDAENQISQVESEVTAEPSGETGMEKSNLTPAERTTARLKSQYKEAETHPSTTPQQEHEPEPDPHTSSVVQGKVKYDDIQSASVIEGGYSADDVRTEVVRYLEKAYPTEMITKIDLLGNGSETSQDTGTPTSYIDYLVTLSKGQRIGLSVTCSTEYSPAVQETNYLLVSPTLLYNVEEDEYIPMSITNEERIPADTVIDH